MCGRLPTGQPVGRVAARREGGVAGCDRGRRFGDDDGSVVPLLAVLVVVVALAGLLVGATVEQQRRQAAAQWAADAAALAAASEGVLGEGAGPASARTIAERNGARLLSISTHRPPAVLGPDVVSMVIVIRVDYRGATAAAAAARFVDNRTSPTLSD